MITTIFVDDYVNNERYHIILGENDIKKVEDNWNNKDALLVNLINTKFFQEKTRWCELRPIHFKILILRNFVHLDSLRISQKNDVRNPIVQSLYFLIGGFLKCLMEHADSNIEFLNILRINTQSINFNYHASLLLELDTFTNQETSLKLIVDNTKTE